MTLQEIINATNADAALTALHDAIKTNKWDSPIVKPFKAVKTELTSTTHGVILRGTRVVIPAALQQRGPKLTLQLNDSLGKALKTATLEGRPWKQELNRFLLQYRTTPHCTTGVPPSELLFNRVIKGKLPVINSKRIVNYHKEARDNEKTRRERNREYANQRRNTRKSDLQVGDYVLVRQEKKNKLTANFNHKPYNIYGIITIKKTGSEILAQSKDGHIVKRNVSHYKRIN
ncbi:Hypothetical predicted protein [Paramuricea clavata]|uniref:Uncharacterized protein n=1 Tax=Paramuricea clavata TaxID=317549 RepID=A0A6S7K0R3_PARCT|nr:Hypothetical predicted protein [Paramuricea clavata]